MLLALSWITQIQTLAFASLPGEKGSFAALATTMHAIRYRVSWSARNDALCGCLAVASRSYPRIYHEIAHAHRRDTWRARLLNQRQPLRLFLHRGQDVLLDQPEYRIVVGHLGGGDDHQIVLRDNQDRLPEQTQGRISPQGRHRPPLVAVA